MTFEVKHEEISNMERTAMKLVLILLGALLIAIAVIFLSGPRVNTDIRLKPSGLPKDLDRYLAESESEFDDIVMGAEKVILWAGKTGVQTHFSLVYLHGFSATRQETAPLSETIAKTLGANLFYTRFTGHGRSGDAMLEGSVSAWSNDAIEALKIGHQIGENVIVIGVSTGGTIATWLAAQPRFKNVVAFILISPNFSPANVVSGMLLWPWGGHIAELIIGKERTWQPDNPRHEKYWTHRYPTRALLPMMGLVSVAKSLDLARVETPVLVLYSPEDNVVDASEIEDAYYRMGSVRKQLIPFTDADDPDQHVLAGDILSPSATEKIGMIIVDFIKKLNQVKNQCQGA